MKNEQPTDNNLTHEEPQSRLYEVTNDLAGHGTGSRPPTPPVSFEERDTRAEMEASNRAKLRALIDLYHLSHSDISKVAGVSRCMITRILNEGISGNGVWARLEANLPELISKRQVAFFEVPAVDPKTVKDAVETINKAG
jgi:hypothetical protein